MLTVCYITGFPMASLTVRQLDEALKKQLRLRAAKHGRSVEDEVRTILRAAAADRAAVLGRAQAELLLEGFVELPDG